MPTDEDMGKARGAELLEVEDEEQRQARMHDVLAKLNASSRLPVPARLLLPDLISQSPMPLDPNPELLSRVQAFLPQLAESNAELARRVQSDPSAVDIENVNANETYIEMGRLGVFEQRQNAGSRSSSDAEMDADADVDSDSSTDDSDTSTSSSDSDSDSTASSSDSSSSDSDRARRPIKPLPTRRPRITVLGGDCHERGS
ncbi:hypothetical protein C8Q72DRAFT_888976 [Fomitopsis betulina]|nr:hypothetical protein C8Q72DRAFT_888976 [Fomitopsis betulina]